MVSDLWKACSEGDLQKVHELLVEVSIADIEIKGASIISLDRSGDPGNMC